MSNGSSVAGTSSGFSLVWRVEQPMVADLLDQHVVLELPYLVGLGVFEGLHQRYSNQYSIFALTALAK